MSGQGTALAPARIVDVESIQRECQAEATRAYHEEAGKDPHGTRTAKLAFRLGVAGKLTADQALILVGELAEHFRKLKARIEELESHKKQMEEYGIRYCGVWQRAIGDLYKKGAVVTHDGSAWVCVKDFPELEPGTCNEWQMLVRRGKEGKEGPKGRDGVRVGVGQ